MKKTMLLFFVLFLLSFHVFAIGQSGTVKGTVTDGDREPIPGVTVAIEGTTSGTITDISGDYEITLDEGQNTLVFSFIGFETQTVDVSGKSEIDVVMQESVVGLDEVVVVGYGSMKKSDLTGSVASVSGDALEKVASNRAIEAIQGRVAGVSITKESGRPGAGMKVRIRGVGSTNVSDPLYVIDGVPGGSDLEHIAPEDIESIEVLKDASATAIYGNKGANGVVIVTTKSGSVKDKPEFSFNSYYGIGEVAHRPEMLDATQHATLILEAAANDNTSLPSSLETRINHVLANDAKGTDWFDEVFRLGTQQNYNLSVRGGIQSDVNEDRELIYSLSGTYFDEEGTVENTNFNKMLFNSKTEYKFNNSVKLGVQLDLFRKESGPFPQGIYGGPIPLAMKTSPMDRGIDNEGNFIPTHTAFDQNPLLVLDHMQYSDDFTNSFGFKPWLEVKLLPGLDFSTTLNISRGNSHYKGYNPSYYINENFNRAQSELLENRSEWNSWTWINLLNFSKTIGNIHRITGTLGHEAAYNENAGIGGMGLEVPLDENLHYMNLAKEYQDKISAWQGQSGTESYFGRAFYSYDDRYMVTGTIRYDGSSKFSEENKWGVFPSVGVSWRASEENFIQNLNIFSDLKLRYGWGRVGNQASAQAGSDVANIGTYGMYYVFGDETSKGGITTNIPTPDLKWEMVETTNIGADLAFLQNKLGVTLDYFMKDTKDMITRVALPGYYPKDRPNANVGTMSNEGYEIAISYKNRIGDLGYSVGANFSGLTNEVKMLNAEEEDAFIDAGFVSKLGNTTRTEAGQEIACFYGYETDGFFRTTEDIENHSLDGSLIQPDAKVGDIRFKDNNNNGEIDAADRAYLGSGTPDYVFGFNFSVDYKGFDLSGNLYGVQGNEIVNAMGYSSFEVVDYINAYASRMDRFLPENNPGGTQSRVTLSDDNNNLRFSDRYVEDGSYIRLKNLQLGYTLPNVLTTQYGIETLRFYVSGQNLLTWTDYTGFDPEVGDLTHDASSDVQSLGIGVDLGNYPQPRLYYFGVNVTF
jgi:TonB-linked SusC/RagA family outer membrane protein